MCMWPPCCAGAVGLYVPGGTAVLPSSTLMLAVPAGIAGCRTIVMATPPRGDGQVPDLARRPGHCSTSGGTADTDVPLVLHAPSHCCIKPNMGELAWQIRPAVPLHAAALPLGC